MSVDTVFKPQGPSTLVGVTAVQIPNGGSGTTSFRVYNTVATEQCFTWGQTAAVVAAGPPTAGVPSPTTICMLPTSVETFEIPSNSWFIGNAGSAFVFVAGQGA
jgi:hypothetical protein